MLTLGLRLSVSLAAVAAVVLAACEFDPSGLSPPPSGGGATDAAVVDGAGADGAAATRDAAGPDAAPDARSGRACGDETCDADEICCFDPSEGDIGECERPERCPFGQLECTVPSDCDDGEHCCLLGAAVTACGDHCYAATVCGDDDDCESGACCPTELGLRLCRSFCF